MFKAMKRLLLGNPLETHRQAHEKLPKKQALAVFASDALSSTAYATEEILLILVLAGTTALSYSLPISLSIGVLLAIVAISYVQTVLAYPSGGGAYIVARQNLGLHPGLVAAAALLIDYVLTVSVSISAGVSAIVSAFPSMGPHRGLLATVFVLLMILGNLRGVRESGTLFSIPAYVFIFSLGAMLVTGLVRLFVLHQPLTAMPPPGVISQPGEMIGMFLILRAFSAGCTALTGIEAISNGVPVFKAPASRNAAITLVWMASILVTLFLGITWFAQHFQIMPRFEETVVSQVARLVFGGGPFYYLVQISTMVILVLAANTSFNDFPRLSSILSHDGFLPRQLTALGDRLVYSNGIVILGLTSWVLIWIFDANPHGLIPLYALGVFLSFTLSQAGMVKHDFFHRASSYWWGSAIINGIGAVTTGAVFLIIVATKFTHGAWIVLLLIPVFVLGFLKIKRYYDTVSEELSIEHLSNEYAIDSQIKHQVVIPVSQMNRGTITSVLYARSISHDIQAVYVEVDADKTQSMKEEWALYAPDIPLVILPSPTRAVVQVVLDYLDKVEREHDDDVVTVILPEFVTRRWWQQFFHNQTALRLRTALLFKRGVVVTSIRIHLDEQHES